MAAESAHIMYKKEKKVVSRFVIVSFPMFFYSFFITTYYISCNYAVYIFGTDVAFKCTS